MNPIVNFKIIALDKIRGQIVVRYFNDDIPDGLTNAIDLPVQGGEMLDLRGQALSDYIIGFCPMSEFVRARAMKSPSFTFDYSYIESLVQAEAVEAIPSEPLFPQPEIITT